VSNFPAVQVAQVIAGPNLPPDTARLRFKNMVAHGYIMTRSRSATDGRGTLLFSEGDILTAAVLSELMDLGGLSREAMQAAALRLQAWKVGEVPSFDPEATKALQAAADAGKTLEIPGYRKPPESPALWMYQTFTDGHFAPPGFTLRLSWQKPVAGGNGFCTAAVSHGDFGDLGEGIVMANDHVPVADLILPIDPILLAVHARLEALDA
jgi:hypothetical protein